MITKRAAQDRGHAQHGWLDSWHSFSFADYHDPKHVHFGPLRVINDDRIAAGRGFGMHPHRDMEIITYVVDGSLTHQDSMGNHATIVPGEVQRMSAGTGVTHSEFSEEGEGSTHLFQIWIIPNQVGGSPSYEQKAFSQADKQGQLRLVVSPDGQAGSVRIQQDARIYAGLFDIGESATLSLEVGRLGYVQVLKGKVSVDGQPLAAGDALLYQDENKISIEGGQHAELLVFDLPSH